MRIEHRECGVYSQTRARKTCISCVSVWFRLVPFLYIAFRPFHLVVFVFCSNTWLVLLIVRLAVCARCASYCILSCVCFFFVLSLSHFFHFVAFLIFFSCVLLFLYGANCLSLHFTRCNHTRLLNSHCNAMGYMCVLSYWCSHYSAPYLWLWLCSEIFVAISRSLSLSTSLFLCSYYAFIIISSLFYELRITLLALLHRVLFVFCFGLFACMLIFATTVCGLSRSSVMRVKE